MVRNRFYLEACAGVEAPQEQAETATAESPESADLSETVEPGQDLSRFRADLHELPIINKALDAVVLHHVLESAADPRTAIREVSRVLAPGGRLLIVSFNPWSLWGVRGAYARLFRDSFSGLRFVSSRRLLDWLTVLGFELQQDVKYLSYGLPFASRRRTQPKVDTGVWSRLRSVFADHSLPFGGVYVMSAVKQAASVRPDWEANSVQGRKLAPAAYPKLSARIAWLPGWQRPGSEGPVRPNPGSDFAESKGQNRIQDPG